LEGKLVITDFKVASNEEILAISLA